MKDDHPRYNMRLVIDGKSASRKVGISWNGSILPESAMKQVL
jgi:hypothetical protein